MNQVHPLTSWGPARCSHGPAANPEPQGGGGRTFAQLVVQEQGRLPTQLPPQQAARLHREAVVVAGQQTVDTEEGLCGVAQEHGLVAHAVVHVHLVALGGERERERERDQNGSIKAEVGSVYFIPSLFSSVQ